ncbi:MAG: hypothetical protein OEM84_06180 [Acidimicrobiia bacterium]|nr:hypothetical protein [Acidimicrobiia bacterium]
MDRRVPFFALVSAVTLALVPLTPDKFRWVTWSVTITYAVFALVFLLNFISRRLPR